MNSTDHKSLRTGGRATAAMEKNPGWLSAASVRQVTALLQACLERDGFERKTSRVFQLQHAPDIPTDPMTQEALLAW